jgi:hypothetical protein
MSLWSDLREGIRQVILIQERVDRLVADMSEAERTLVDHDRRLTRVETVVAIALGRQLPPNS